VDGEEAIDGVGVDHGLAEVHSATYRHGRDLDGYLDVVLAGGSMDIHGVLDGIIHTIIHGHYTRHIRIIHCLGIIRCIHCLGGDRV